MLEGVLPLSFQMFLVLQVFEPLDLHHQVQSPLFVSVLGFQAFLLIELSVSDGHSLGVEAHLVHVLYIVLFFIKSILRFF